MKRRASHTPDRLAAAAAYVLGGNDLGGMTSAAPALYPHVWSWDAAFIAAGLAKVSVTRALAELETLLQAQWRTGMLPHIVFSPDVAYYAPGPDWWRCAQVCPDAPRSPATSGILQPPVHAITLERILINARATGGTDEAVARDFLGRHWDALVAWHRYLATRRDPETTGLLSIYHGWESGMDNSPRWDSAYEAVVPGPLPYYSRSDTTLVNDATQRPTDIEYDRYLWLVLQLRRAGYRDEVARRAVDFHVADVFMSAVFAAANDVLADIAADIGRPEGPELRRYAERFRAGVLSCVDAVTGLAVDRNLRTGEFLHAQTFAGFAPLISGGLPPDMRAAMLDLFESAAWCGHPALRFPVPPSTSPLAPEFDTRSYWRGPQWPIMSWLFGWALDRLGEHQPAARLREATLQQVSDGTFAEYYEPHTAEPLGSHGQSWTAALVLDWVL
jgi:hypothetical protein